MDIKDAGHLTTKSSVFQPTQMGAGGQQEIIRHMSRHYDRVTKATAVTDTSPPKSYKNSTLVRDRVKKQPIDQQKYASPIKVNLDKFEQCNDMITLTTNDSDVKSILRHVPSLRKKLKPGMDSVSESDSLNTAALEHLARDGSPRASDRASTAKSAVSITTQECRELAKGIVTSAYNKEVAAAGSSRRFTPKSKDRPDPPRTPTNPPTPRTPTNPPTPRTQSNMNNTVYKGSRSNINLISTFDTRRDDETLYLQFVADITQEIVTTGLTSDRALKMLFERHTAQNKTVLREDEMVRRIDELKIKLNIS